MTLKAKPILNKRSSGILLHLTSLPGPHGIGDLGQAAYDFIDFLKEFKLQFSGLILSRNKIQDLQGKKKSGFYEYEVELNADELEKIKDYYFLLLDCKGQDIEFKVKRSYLNPENLLKILMINFAF